MTAALHDPSQVSTTPPVSGTDHDWFQVISEVLQGEGPDLAVQPIVDLVHGAIVGYEALSRFPGDVGPEVWFAAADQVGLGGALEARSLAAGLALRPDLPQSCFLSVNISPTALSSPDVGRVLDAAGHLGGVVIELTEHRAITDLNALARLVGDLRAHGAKVSIEDAGSGYAGLQWLATIRPDIVKVDRELVAGLDRDATKVAMLEMLGALSGHLDGWLLAVGVERVEELDALIRLGVPLAQGYLLAQPCVEAWPSLAPSMARHIRTRADRRPEGHQP